MEDFFIQMEVVSHAVFEAAPMFLGLIGVAILAALMFGRD